MAAATTGAVRRGGSSLPDPGDAFLDDELGQGSYDAATRRAPAAAVAASRPGVGVDDETSRFFGRSSGESPRAGRPPKPPSPGPDDAYETVVDDLDQFDDESYDRSFDATAAFDQAESLDREPTPALLAAKAEPLVGSQRPKRSSRKPVKSSRSKGSDAARVSKSRTKKRRKPKEPSNLWLGAGLVAVLLAGFATAYVLSQRGSDDDVTEADTAEDAEQALTDSTLAGEQDATGSTDSTVAADPAAAAGSGPVVTFDEAAVGPIDAEVPYNIGTGPAGPEGALYQLLVDGAPQADLASTLPPVTFTPGRHLLVISMVSPSGDIATDPVLVYAVGPVPAAGHRANLSSVNIQEEGWAEAVRQYDEFVAAGHTNLELMQSDRFPALTPGYWNLFVGGFGSHAAAEAYCEEYGLAVPDQCFPTLADPSATAGG